MLKLPRQHKKSAAQAMVEFALILPLLLTVLYGLLEVGRLIFIYSSVVTSARSAARYGATIGLNTSGGVPRFQDCDGIRAAAQNTAFIIGEYADTDIVIEHDDGEGVNTTAYCPPGLDPHVDVDYSFSPSTGNNERVRVTVSSQFSPIVTFLPLDPITISSTSARTVLVSISIAITGLPATWVGATNTVGPSPTPPPTNTPTITPTCAVPGSTTLSGVIAGGDRSDLSWTVSFGATSYDLYSAADGINYSFVGTYTGTSANNVDTISPGMAYYYILAPKKECGDGPISNTLFLANGATFTPTITPSPTKTPSPTITPSPTKTGTPTFTPTITPTPFACDVRHSVLKTSPTFSMTVYNYSASVTINISQIQIYWHADNPGGQELNTIAFGGVTIWSGVQISTPFVVSSFSGNVSVAPSASKLIQLSFKKPYNTDGTERILVNFAENGCPTLDSANSGQLP